MSVLYTYIISNEELNVGYYVEPDKCFSIKHRMIKSMCFIDTTCSSVYIS